MTKLQMMALLATLPLAAAAMPAQAAGLVNGSFEDPAVLNNGTYGRGQLPTGWTGVPGWELPDIVGPGYTQGGAPFLVLLTAQDGGNYIDANGLTTVGALQQLVTGFDPGASLSLSFWTSSWAQNSAGSLTVELLDGSNSALLGSLQVVYPFDNTRTSAAWSQSFINAVAPASGSVIVRFFGSSGALDQGAPGLDNMALVARNAVPEPASWALMIGGFGLAGAAMRRRAARVVFAA